VAKVGTSNSDRTISLRLQCVVRKRNTTNFYSLFIQADMFRPMFLGHLQVTRNVCLEEVIQVSHKMEYVE